MNRHNGLGLGETSKTTISGSVTQWTSCLGLSREPGGRGQPSASSVIWEKVP